jgi:protein-disulfide isomerase
MSLRLLTVGFLGTLAALGCIRVSDQPNVVEDPRAASVVLPASVPRKGADPARVTVIEFGDFQCPYCGNVQPTIRKVFEKYPDSVALAFVNDPLSFHEHALPCAKAFLAAARQGQAWAMHDQMFAHQSALSDADLDSYAAAIGLDLAQFDADRASQEIADQVTEQVNLATSLDIEATPTFLIGGYRIEGAQPFSAFSETIDKILAAPPPDAGPPADAGP